MFTLKKEHFNMLKYKQTYKLNKINSFVVLIIKQFFRTMVLEKLNLQIYRISIEDKTSFLINLPS